MRKKRRMDIYDLERQKMEIITVQSVMRFLFQKQNSWLQDPYSCFIYFNESLTDNIDIENIYSCMHYCMIEKFNVE